MSKSKRQRVMDLVEGRATSSDYVPAAFFLHFGDEFEVGRPAIDKHLDYFRFTGMDFVKIQYEAGFPERPEIREPADWARMPRPGKEFYEDQLGVVAGLVEAGKQEQAPVIVTLYSPFMLAGHAVPTERLVAHIEQDPAATRKGIEIAAESLLVFVRECIRIGVDGFYASTQGGESGRFSRPELFAECVKPFDLMVWEEIGRCPFNILHICDYHLPYDDLSPFLEYPGHVVSCPLRLAGEPLSPRRVADMFGRPSMGGLDRKGTIVTGSHEEIRSEVQGLLAAAGDRYVLGADCTLPPDADWEKIRTAITAAHEHAAD